MAIGGSNSVVDSPMGYTLNNSSTTVIGPRVGGPKGRRQIDPTVGTSLAVLRRGHRRHRPALQEPTEPEYVAHIYLITQPHPPT